jgi:class 3 adenylate cyclase
MTFLDDIDKSISAIREPWDVSTAQVNSKDVPDESKLVGTNASMINAAYLYSDIVNSSGLMAVANEEAVASVMAAFLKVSVRVIRFHEGHIRSFDGDRVMGIFTGPRKASRAVSAALQINYAVNVLLDPKVQAQFKSIRDSSWKLRQMSGISTSKALMVKVGIRNNSDLLSTGVAPNLAAKLSELRLGDGNSIAISKGTYKAIENSEKYSKGLDMWSGPRSISVGDRTYSYYSTRYRRKIS